MNPENIARRQDELNKIKKGLKDWEYGFLKSHKRKPTIKDIQERPKVERVYKDYNSKKKRLRLLSEECMDSQSLSQPISFDSQQQSQRDPLSQESNAHSPSSSSSSQPLSPSQKRRRGSHASVEYIRSPSHRLSRIKYVDHLERPTTSLDFYSKPNTLLEKTSSNNTRSAATDADSFWLTSSQDASCAVESSGDTTTTNSIDNASGSTTPYHENSNSLLDSSSNSGNTTSSFLLADNSNNTLSNNTSIKKKKKKNAALEQKLFGHLIWKPRDTLSPALKAERDSSSQPTTPTAENGMSLDSQTSMDQPMDLNTTQVKISTTEMITDKTPSATAAISSTLSSGKTIGDLKIDGLIITEHEQDRFRHFDPDLLTNMEDPDYFVMPGLFSSARARSTIMTPMMEDDNGRYNRILEAMRQGTLGEKRRDDSEMDVMDSDLKRFIDENTDTFADHTSTVEQEESLPTYRKKFTQRRQTRLHKFKYVESTPSNL